MEIAISLSLCRLPVSSSSPPPAFTPSLDFSDGRNSQYLPLIFA